MLNNNAAIEGCSDYAWMIANIAVMLEQLGIDPDQKLTTSVTAAALMSKLQAYYDLENQYGES